MTEYYFPNANVGFRSISPLAVSGTDYVLYDCIRNVRNIFSLGGASSVTAYGTAGIGITGFSGATVDASGNPWTCQYLGAYQGPGVSGQITAAGATMGVAYGPYSQAYFAQSSGALYAASGDTASLIASFPTSAPCYGLAVSGDTLFTIGNGNQSLIGIAMSSATSGTVTDYTLPFATGSCVAAASGVVAIGGYNFVTLASGSPGIQGLAISADGVLAIGDAGTVSFWPQSGASWAYGTSVSGLGTASNLAWNEAGSQVLLAGGGDVYVIGYSAGVATLAQTIAIADASNIAVSGSVAIVSQNASGTVTILNESGSTWASGQVITGLTGCEQAIFTSASGAFVAYASGVAELTYGGGTWSLSSSPISGVAAQGVAFDRNGNPYATFNNGASGGFIAYTGATATWAGAASGIFCVQDQFVVADPANGLLRLIGPNSTGGYQQYGTETAPASGASAIAYGAAILAGGPSSVDQYYWGHPWSLHRERSGALSVFANGAFSSPVSLGVGITPTCATIDASGNAWFGAGNNDVYEVSSAGALTQTIPVAVYPGQISGTSLGMSSLAWVNNHLYATTSLSGVLIEVI